MNFSLRQLLASTLSLLLLVAVPVLGNDDADKLKVKALSAEAKSSAMVLASLPPGVMFMVYGTAPDYIMPLFVTKTGNLFLLGGCTWMGIGVLVMRKMINFKY